MSGGGGGTPQIQDNSMQVEMARQAAAREEQQRQDALKAQQRTDFTNKLGSAVEGARTTGTNYLASRGLSPDLYGSVIDSIINDAKLKVPDLDTNPGSYFTTDTFASGLDNYQNVKRANATGKVNSTFAPGFESGLLSDTSDDSILNSILDTQRTGAIKQLDFNRSRGLLNDAGYNEAMNEISRQGNAGLATLTGIGDSVLGKGRQALSDIRGEAGTAASNWMLGMPDFSVDPYNTRLTDKANSLRTNLEGDIRSSLGSTNLFDVAGAISRGGTAQGPINLTTSGEAPGVPFSTKKNRTGRGLGSDGVF